MGSKVFSSVERNKFTLFTKVLLGVCFAMFVCQMVLGSLAIFTSISIADSLILPVSGLFWIVFIASVLCILLNHRATNGRRAKRYTEPSVFSREGYRQYTTPMKVLLWVVCLLVVCQPVLLVFDFFSVFDVVPWQIAGYVLMIWLIMILYAEGQKLVKK